MMPIEQATVDHRHVPVQTHRSAPVPATAWLQHRSGVALDSGLGRCLCLCIPDLRRLGFGLGCCRLLVLLLASAPRLFGQPLCLSWVCSSLLHCRLMWRRSEAFTADFQERVRVKCRGERADTHECMLKRDGLHRWVMETHECRCAESRWLADFASWWDERRLFVGAFLFVFRLFDSVFLFTRFGWGRRIPGEQKWV